MSEKREILEQLRAETLRDMIVDLWAAVERRDTDLEFAYKRAKVLADLLGIPVHESPEVTGTILGLVRGSVERMIAERDLFKKETVALAKDIQATPVYLVCAQWEPIETAPRDGIPLLLCTDGGIVFVGKLNKHLQLWVDDQGRERFRTVCYWMPLPKPPTHIAEVMPMIS